MVGCDTMATDMPTPYFGKQTEYYPGSLLSGIDNKTIAQREKSHIFFSSLTWTPPGTPWVSKDGPLSTKLGFGSLVL